MARLIYARGHSWKDKGRPLDVLSRSPRPFVGSRGRVYAGPRSEPA